MSHLSGYMINNQSVNFGARAITGRVYGGDPVDILASGISSLARSIGSFGKNSQVLKNIKKQHGGMRRQPVIPYEPEPTPEELIEEANLVIEELRRQIANPDTGDVTSAVLEREIAGMKDVIEEQTKLLDNQPMEQEDQDGEEESKNPEPETPRFDPYTTAARIAQGEEQLENIDDDDIEGMGLLVREPGKLPPAGRKLLEEVGNEEIKSLEIVRTPLSNFTRGFLNVISLGQFDKISKKYYDQMFHLSLLINGKYNLEKNEVVYFNRENPKKSNSQVKPVSVIPAGITIQALIDNTIKRMGGTNFSEYDPQRLNCQNFLLNVLAGSGIGDKSDESFIFQDATQIFKELPEFSKVLGKASVKLGAIFNRLIYGEGQEGGASIGQIGEAAALRTWIDRKIDDPNTGLPMRDTLNQIVHSGDKEGSSQYNVDNPFNDIFNNYDPRIDYTINFPYLNTLANDVKFGRRIYKPRYPTRTLGL